MNDLNLKDLINLWNYNASNENVFCFFENTKIKIKIENLEFNYNNIKIILTDNYLIFINDEIKIGILSKEIIYFENLKIKFIYENILMIKIIILKLETDKKVFINNLKSKINF